jgi:hypothetical protein
MAKRPAHTAIITLERNMTLLSSREGAVYATCPGLLQAAVAATTL